MKKLAFGALLLELCTWVSGFHSHSVNVANHSKRNPGGAVQPIEICIDYGSSGPKIFWCPSQSWHDNGGQCPPGEVGIQCEKKEYEHRTEFINQAIGGAKIPGELKGGGSFGRMLQEVEHHRGQKLVADIQEKFHHYFGSAKYVVRVCRATAGNRFISLVHEQEKAWSEFNLLLEKVEPSLTFDADGKCTTVAGTCEATFEYTLARQKNQDTTTFVGIGGASLQLRVPTSEPCPEQIGGATEPAIVGGWGASKIEHFCLEHKGDGALWSFLSDRVLSESHSHTHIVGGMDESVNRFWLLVLPGDKDGIALQVERYQIGPTEFDETFERYDGFPVMMVISKGGPVHGHNSGDFYDHVYMPIQKSFVYRDSVFKAWMTWFHKGEYPKRIAEVADHVALLSNFKRIAETIKEVRRHVNLTDKEPDNWKTIVHAILWKGWEERDESGTCKCSVRHEGPCQIVTSGKYTNGINAEQAYVDMTPSELATFDMANAGFACAASMYLLGVFQGIAGVNVDNLGKGSVVWGRNMEMMLNGKSVKGDWMGGYLLWESEVAAARRIPLTEVDEPCAAQEFSHPAILPE